MASGGRPGQGPRLRARAESAVVSIPRPRRGDRLELGRVAPSARSVVVGLSLAAAVGAAYLAASTTGLFAVRSVTVTGADPRLSADVRAALEPALGDSLVGLDVPALRGRVESLPTIAVATLDRAFPHELAVTVVPERPVAVLRQGADSWLASARGRVIARLPRGARPGLPRVWLGRGTRIAIGETLPGAPGASVHAVAALAGSGLGLRVRSVLATRTELTLVLRSRLEVRLGDATQVRLKLAVAASVLPRLDDSVAYLDVAVPERPVAGPAPDPQADIEVEVSTTP